MPTVLSVRLSQPLSDALHDLCAALEVNPSTLVRALLQHAVTHPDWALEIVVQSYPDVAQDLRTEEQVAAWERDHRQLIEACDVQALVAAMPPMPEHTEGA